MNMPHIVSLDNMKDKLHQKEEAALICYACKTTLIPLQDRTNLFLTKDEEVEPVELLDCPRCGREFMVHDKEAGMVILEMPQVRA